MGDSRWGPQAEGVAAGRVPGPAGTPELGGSCWCNSEVCASGKDAACGEGFREDRTRVGRWRMGSSRARSGEAPGGAWVFGPPHWVCGGATHGDLTQAGHSATGARLLGWPPSGNQNTASVGENAEELEPSAPSAGTRNAATTVENSPAVPQGTELSTTPSGHVPRARRAGSRRGSCTHVSTAALSTTATGWKQAKCPSRDGGQTTRGPSLWQKDPSTIKKPGTLTPARAKGTLRTSCSG